MAQLPMTENDVTETATRVIFEEIIGRQPAIAPCFEIVDEDGLKPDRVIVALDDELKVNTRSQIEPDDLVIHTIESKVERRYLIGPEFTGVIQASEYWGQYNWLAVAEDADLTDNEWEELRESCEKAGVGLIVCGRTAGQIVHEPEYDDTEHFTHYPRWREIFAEFCQHVGFERGA